MATTVARLSSNGVYFTNTYFDEVTYTNNSITPTAIYSGTFDEVTYNGDAAAQKVTASTLFVSNYFDEVTGIDVPIPGVIIGTIISNTATISAASPFGTQYNSYRFAGTTSSLITLSANNGDFAVGTGDFTVEWWQYETDINGSPRPFTVGYWPTALIAASNETNTYLWMNNSIAVTYNVTKTRNAWRHYAMVRNGTSLALYISGTLAASATNTSNITNTTTNMLVGGDPGPSNTYTSQMFGGLIYNFRFTKGIAVYTGNFTIPTGPLTQTATANPFGGTNTAAIPPNAVKVLLNP